MQKHLSYSTPYTINIPKWHLGNVSVVIECIIIVKIILGEVVYENNRRLRQGEDR